MSYCTCPEVPKETQERLVGSFLEKDITLGDLPKLLDHLVGSTGPHDEATVEAFKRDIVTTVPFRGGPCPRSLKCCGMCTRQCDHRCIQDILNRTKMWQQMVVSQDVAGNGASVPLNLRLLLELVKREKFDHAQLSWAVGDILSRKTNTKLKEYMSNAGLRPEENPYKLEYGPQIETIESPKTGRKIKVTSTETGYYSVLSWPTTGMCPFCLPDVTISQRYSK